MVRIKLMTSSSLDYDANHYTSQIQVAEQLKTCLLKCLCESPCSLLSNDGANMLIEVNYNSYFILGFHDVEHSGSIQHLIIFCSN